MPSLVEELLERSARVQPDKVALVFGSRRLTYREINDAADQLAAGLRAFGIRPGDRVVIHLENCVEAVISIFGILKARAAFVPVGRTVKADKLAYILNDCDAAGLVADSRAHQVTQDALTQAPTVKVVVAVGEQSDSITPGASCKLVAFDDMTDPTSGPTPEAGDRPNRGIDLDLAALVYTSGSTGLPKGVMLTHLNIMTAAASISAYLENTAEDSILDVLPLSFDYGLYQVFLAFRAGARLILERSFVYPTLMLDLLVQERVTALPVVPMVVAVLLKHDLSAHDFSSLRYITNTGAALPPAHIAALRQRLPNVRIFSMYGLTECKRVSFLAPEEIDRRPTSVGKPMDNVETFVADERGQLHETGVGELVIRGSNVMQGYWRAPEETARVLKPGSLPGQYLLYSGDRFRIDEEGYLYFEGRLDDVIKSRGQRVSPREVENVLYEIPGVTGAAVVGVDDELLGSAVKAFVSVDPASALEELHILQHCARRLEDFMVPKIIEFVEALPRTESGKVDRRHLPGVHGTALTSGSNDSTA